MKKIIAVMCSIVAFTASATVMNSLALDYECHHYEYDDYSYYTCNEHKIGTFSYEKNRFSGCDLYTHETVEAYEGMQAFTTKYDYIMVPDDLIGSWFEKTMDYTSSFYVKLPLHTGYNLNYSTLELEEAHRYDINIICKRIPYFRIVTDTDTSWGFDMDKAEEFLPRVREKSLGKDTNGNYVYYLSTDFDKIYFDDAEKILTKEDAEKLLEFKNEHLISLNYCEEYDLKYIPFDEYPVYYENDIENVSEYFKKSGIDFTVEKYSYDEQMIIPDEAIPAPEYYELISEIQEETGIMPRIINNEAVSIEINSTEMFNAVKGDANSDEQFNIADVVTLKKFLLLGKGTVGMNADMNNDNTVDVFDMILMRQYFSETFIK